MATSDLTEVPASAGPALANSRPICCASAYNGTGVPSAPTSVPVILLLAIQRAAPLPVTDHVCTVSHGVPGHCPDFSFVQGVVDWGPVYRSRLGLHDPKVLAFKPASQIVGKAVFSGIEMSLPHVVIPGGEVEIFL